MTEFDPNLRPRLRPVEARPVPIGDQQGFVLVDPTGLATSSISVSGPALFLMSMFDGEHTLEEVRTAFAAQYGQLVDTGTLAGMVQGLAEAKLLADESFEQYYETLVDAYRAAPARVMRSAPELGLDHDAPKIIDEMLAANPVELPIHGHIVGLVAPHLDYARGGPCYAAAYSMLVNRPVPRRLIVLGTNHFGLSTSAVATAKAFETPLGTTEADAAFIDRLEARCGDLRTHELDHQREHSVELQVLICQHLWGADAFRIVPVLCTDPCGPMGTASYDGCGVDLRDLGAALRELVEEDGEDTLVIAGADLSHVGAEFGDERVVDSAFREEVRRKDQAALDGLERNDPESFLAAVRQDDNATRVCSAGCIFTAMTMLPKAEVRVLRYHQAIDKREQVGVTCAAAVMTV